MSEKRWTDDERDEAFDRGMETMQRVALELYRRGREEAREELETVKRERDEARAEVERLRERLRFDPGGSDKIDELEDAVKYLRAEVDHWKGAAKEHAEMQDDARAEVERLRMMLPVHPSSLTDACTDAYSRGAAAMREACARMEPYAYNLDDHLMISKWRSLVRGLPIPEDK